MKTDDLVMMHKNRNVVEIQHQHCITCSKCVELCPQNALSLNSDQYCSRCIRYCMSMDVPCHLYHIEVDVYKCNDCGICIEHCPERAIKKLLYTDVALIKVTI
jgi:ferredoxin